MNQTLYQTLKETAEKINELNPTFGRLALRKVNAVNENSSLETLIQTGDDLVLIAERINDPELSDLIQSIQ